MKHKFFLALVIFFLSGVHRMSAFVIGPVNFYVTNESELNLNRLADDTVQFYETLSILSTYKQWSMGLTLRGFNYHKQFPNQTLVPPRFDLFRKFVQYSSENLNVHVGDFYASLGRGLVLSVLKNDDVFRERTILGGDIVYNKGRISLRALGGVLQDETHEQRWALGGGEAVVEVIKNNRLGARFSYVDGLETQTDLGKRVTYSISLSGDQILENFSYYMEFAALDFLRENSDNGYGIFSNLTFSHGHVTVFGEFKKYENFDNEINTPPVTDREDEIVPGSSTTGGRLFFQYAFFDPGIILFFNVGRYEEFGDAGNHCYAGFGVEDLWDKLTMSVTYGIRDVLYRQKRLDFYFIYQLTDILGLELTIKDKRYRDGSLYFTESDQVFQVSVAPVISVFVMHQYSRQRLIDLNHFFSGGMRINLSGRTVIELSGGTIRGGQVCSGGQCYVAPPFKGIKLSLFHIFK